MVSIAATSAKLSQLGYGIWLRIGVVKSTPLISRQLNEEGRTRESTATEVLEGGKDLKSVLVPCTKGPYRFPMKKRRQKIRKTLFLLMTSSSNADIIYLSGYI